ncbi:hypothetical protein IGI65_000781 [Enterococcus sp. DIV0755b]|uniref:SpaA isopeptide-forming pilin-related protein n=1 Tax=Enterococcus sp. DIV0755b TaxID=2774657 RepID=UPI003F2672B3
MKKEKILSLVAITLLLVPYLLLLTGVNAKADEIYHYQDKRFIATEEVDISYNYIVNQKENSIYWQIDFTKNVNTDPTKLGIEVVDIDDNLVAATNTKFPESKFNRTTNSSAEIGVMEKKANKVTEKTTYQLVFRTQIRTAEPTYRLGIRLLGYHVQAETGQLQEINFHSVGKVLEMTAAPVEKIAIVALEPLLEKNAAVTPISASQLKVLEQGNWQDYKATKSQVVVDAGTQLRLEQSLDMKKFTDHKAVAQAIGKAENQSAQNGKATQLSYTFQFGIDKRFKLPEKSNLIQPIRLENKDINYGYYKIIPAKTGEAEHTWEVTLNQNAFSTGNLILPLVLEMTIDLEDDSGSENLLLAKDGSYQRHQQIQTTQLSFKIEETTPLNQAFVYDEELGGVPIIWETTITPKMVDGHYAKISDLSLTSEDITPPYQEDETSSADGFDFFFMNQKLQKRLKDKQLPLFQITAYDEKGREVEVPQYELINEEEKQNRSQLQFLQTVAEKLVIQTTTLTRVMHPVHNVSNRVTGSSKNAGSASSEKSLTVPEHRLHLVNDSQVEDLFSWRATYYRNAQNNKTITTTGTPGVETITLTVNSGKLNSDSIKIFDENGIKGRKLDERLYSVSKVDDKTVTIEFFDFVKNSPKTKLTDGRYYICYESSETTKQKVLAKAVSDQGLTSSVVCEKQMEIDVNPLQFNSWEHTMLWQIDAQVINAAGAIDFSLTPDHKGQSFYFNKGEVPQTYNATDNEQMAANKGIVIVATNAAGKNRYLKDDEYSLRFDNIRGLVATNAAWQGKKPGICITIPEKTKMGIKKITIYVQTATGGVTDIKAMSASRNNFYLNATLTQDQHNVSNTGAYTIGDANFVQNVASQADYNESRNQIDWQYYGNTRRYNLKKGQSFTIELDQTKTSMSSPKDYHYFTEKDLKQIRIYQLQPDENSKAKGIYANTKKTLLDKSQYHLNKKSVSSQNNGLYKEVEVVLDEAIGCFGIGIEVSSTFDRSGEIEQENNGSYSFLSDFSFRYDGQIFQKSEAEYVLDRSQLFCKEGFYNLKDSTVTWDLLVNPQGRTLEQLVIESAATENQTVDLTSVEVFHPTIVAGEYFPGEKLKNNRRRYDVKLNAQPDYQNGFQVVFNRKVDYPLYIRYKTKVKGESATATSKTRVSANEQKTLEVTQKIAVDNHSASQKQNYTLNIVNLVKGPTTPIRNSQFRLEKNNGRGWETITSAIKTNEHGLANVKDLAAGKYRLVATRIDGFHLNKEPINFEVPFDNEGIRPIHTDDFLVTGTNDEIAITVYNEVKPFDLTIIYKDNEGNTLTGGRVHFASQDGTINYNLPGITAPEAARFEVKDLPIGTYQLQELQAPKDYQEMISKVTLAIFNTGSVSIGGDNTNLDYLGGFVNGDERSFVKLAEESQNNQIMIEILNHPIAATKAQNQKNRQMFSVGIATIFAIRNITNVYYVCGTTPIRIVDKKKVDKKN